MSTTAVVLEAVIFALMGTLVFAAITPSLTADVFAPGKGKGGPCGLKSIDNEPPCNPDRVIIPPGP